METIDRTITVHAPVKKVYDYLREPGHLLTLLPGVLAIEEVEHLDNGGWKFRWERTLCGVRFEGIGVCSELAPLQGIGYTLTGGLHNDLYWTLTPVATGTDVQMTMSYEIPRPLERKHLPDSIRHECIEDAVGILNNLVAVFEETEEVNPSPKSEIWLLPPVIVTH